MCCVDRLSWQPKADVDVNGGQNHASAQETGGANHRPCLAHRTRHARLCLNSPTAVFTRTRYRVQQFCRLYLQSRGKFGRFVPVAEFDSTAGAGEMRHR